MSDNAHFEKLWDLIKPVKIGMLVTENSDQLHAIPMHLVQDKFEGNLYFFTHHLSNKIFEIQENKQVCVTFSSPEKQIYVSTSGDATVCKDKSLIDKFWNVFVSAWFPDGKDDPNVTLIKIKVQAAEYWDSSSSKFIQLIQYAKAFIKEEQPQIGEHEKFDAL